MRKTLVIIAVVALAAIWGVSTYNSLVSSQEGVSAKWAQVESAYQRRADLIPNLVETVKGYAAHEENTLTEVVEARAKATSITLDPTALTPEAIAQFQKAQGELSTALGRLLLVRENYPDLKANENFLELQAQLEGTENRINVARNEFNESAREFNTKVRKFPANIIASLCKFDTKAYFEADESAAQAPKVSFEK